MLTAFRVISLLIAACVLGNVHAEPETKEQKVGIMVPMAQMRAQIATSQVQLGRWTEALETANEAKAEIEQRTDAALAAAKGHPELLRAIKEFIVSSNAFFDAVIPGSDTPQILATAQLNRLRSEMDSKAKMLELELKTAGLRGK